MPLSPDRTALVLKHLALVRDEARRLRKRLPGLEQDELEAVGRLGLLQAAERWDGLGDFTFWARIRVEGAMRDEARRVFGRRRDRTSVELPPDDVLIDRPRRNTPPGVIAADVALVLRACQATLPPRTWTILQLYFAEGRTHKEIGALYGITESRSIQIVNAAVQTIRAALGVR